MPALVIPYTFLSGTLARSAEVNENFEAIRALLSDTGIDGDNIADNSVGMSKLEDKNPGPVGMFMFGPITNPDASRFAEADGSEITTGTSTKATAYVAWSAANGNPYGSSGAGKAYLPDARGRTLVGAGTGTGGGLDGTGHVTGGTALTARAAGAWGGDQTHALTAAETAVKGHSHTGNTGSGSLAGAESWGGGAFPHGYRQGQHAGGTDDGDGYNLSYVTTDAASGGNGVTNLDWTRTAPGVNVTVDNIALADGADGTAHQNMQPWLAVKVWVKMLAET